jgi:hypothetical protein
MDQASDPSTGIFDAAINALRRAGLDDVTGKKYAFFAVEIYAKVSDDSKLQSALLTYQMRTHYNAVDDDPKLKVAIGAVDLVTGTAKARAALSYADRARALSLDESASRFAAKGAEGAGGAIAAFVDCFSGLAKSLGIGMNECALAITKVALDALTMYAMAETVVGIWPAALMVLSTCKDAEDVAHQCFG